MPSSKRDKERKNSPVSRSQPIASPTKDQDDFITAPAVGEDEVPDPTQPQKERKQKLLKLGRTVARHATGMALKGLEGGPPSMEKRIAKAVLKGLDAKLKKREEEDAWFDMVQLFEGWRIEMLAREVWWNCTWDGLSGLMLMIWVKISVGFDYTMSDCIAMSLYFFDLLLNGIMLYF
jgi:hypothetical protein